MPHYKYLNLRSNRLKFVLHGFFFSGATSVAEPSTILPLLVSFFSSNSILVGLFSSLLRGGSIIMQLFAAFYAQGYKSVMKFIRIIFIFRFLSWFSIGISIYFFGNSNGELTLLLVGLGLFLFSFSSGFGSVYFNELLGKSFSNEYRGKTLAYRQFFSGLSSILSGFIAAWVLNEFRKPYSFAFLFIFSSIIMLMGYIALGTVKESEKHNITKRENSFTEFISNAIKRLKADKRLQIQIVSMLFSYSYLLAFPFIILEIKKGVSYGEAGMMVSFQMAGAMFSNILWGRLSANNKNKLIISLSYILIIAALLLSLLKISILVYFFLFFIGGAAMDGFKLAFNNLILIISPESKRPVYIAIQNNITALGLFFSIPGGALLAFLGFKALIITSVAILFIGFVFSRKIVG